MSECEGEHRFHVTETGTVTNEGGLSICSLIICITCGASKLVQHNIADGGNYLVTTTNQKEK